ncbi:unnamed protein product [Polarella glacialis]|uniref:RCC1-like domain-containing protein n=1 Tax=Polarella glacialis TaxID=89957 RepID=A0A813E3V1_POLGL|nr:unnamed protein product [Polarella glacialis]CAE8723303.1 unnamed protein product [Polarella glacialis]
MTPDSAATAATTKPDPPAKAATTTKTTATASPATEATAERITPPASAAGRAGQLFTWGRGSDGQLGQAKVLHPGPNCALPHPVPSLRNVVHVAVGGGQQGCTAAVTSAGELFTFGNNFKGRLGHGEGPAVREPRRVLALAGEHVLMAACGPDHAAVLVQGGRIFLWGANRAGQLGRGHCDTNDATSPVAVALPAAATQVDCEDQYSAAVLADGRIFAWGSNSHGRLGIVSKAASQASPAEVPLGGARLAACVSLGSLYAGAVSTEGEVLMWGYGGHGNLGLGSRASFSQPQKVNLGEAALQVACTRGQEGCKGGLNPKEGGAEGPHTVVVATPLQPREQGWGLRQALG